jgi:hypothetical protein
MYMFRLRKAACQYMDDSMPIVIKEIPHSLGKIQCPYVSVISCVLFWLGTEEIVKCIETFNSSCLPMHDLLNTDLYENIITEKGRTSDAITGVQHGVEFTKKMKEAIPLFTDSYTKAKEDNTEILVLPLAFYNDDFCRFKDSKVDMTILIISLSKYAVYTIIIHNISLYYYHT